MVTCRQGETKPSSAEEKREKPPAGAVIIDGGKTNSRTINLSLRALGAAQFRMRLHDQTLDERIEEMLLAMMEPKKAQEMAMESLTSPWGVGPDTN